VSEPGPNSARVALLGMMKQLEALEWASTNDVLGAQFRQLVRLAEHCDAYSPSFRQRLHAAGLAPDDLGSPSGLSRLPVLTRRLVQAAGEELFSRSTPASHGPVTETQTSGSTGEPVVVRRTGLNGLVRHALTMRDHQWHGRDLNGRLCVIRGNTPSYRRHSEWGPPASLLGPTGPLLSLPLTADIRQLTAWVAEFEPHFLLLPPSTLDALAAECERNDISLSRLAQIRTFGETLQPTVRQYAAATFGVPVVDCYSSCEFGYIALTCPVSGMYHVMAESVIAEVLDAEGRPCGPGATGRIALTDLHNYATPLVRYDIGDYAEVAAPCPCGRHLPTWSRILGRHRNLILLPDGSRHWPITGFGSCRDIAPIRQFQVIQHDPHSFEARLVVERSLSESEEDALRGLFHACIGYPFALRFTYVEDRLPVGASGKFEDFVCHASPA
jgi:phenylacetate-CoA ligase